MVDFKKQAEEWAEKELKNNPLVKEKSQEMDDFVEMMMFGSVGYRIDKDGNKTKLSQQELLELKQLSL